jgi:hypothetical protein
MSLNIFVLDFLKQFDNSDELINKWESDKNQKKLKRTMKGTKTKDPFKPKRGKSGFLFFCDEKRPQLLKEESLSGNKLTVKEVVSKLGAMWQDLKKEGMTAPYEIESQKDRDRYHTQMQDYRVKLRTQKTKSMKKTTKVKKNNPFDNYLKSKKPKIKKKHPEKEDDAIVELLKEKWKKLPSDKKNKYDK